MPRGKHATALLTIFASASTLAQSVNIEWNLNSGPGSGTPSTSFAGAALRSGLWNTCNAASTGPYSLTSVIGTTGISLSRAGSTGGVGVDNPNTTGDYNVMFDDAASLGTSGTTTLQVSNLIPGQYRVYVYAIHPGDDTARTNVSVTGSFSPNPQVIGGVMPFNAFAYGVTHSVHDILASSGSITITVAPSVGVGVINGMQVALLAPRRLYVRANAVPGGDGLTWARAFNTLEPALDAARTYPGVVNEIWVSAGTYYPSLRLDEADARSAVFTLPGACAIYGGFAGTETTLTARNTATNVTILSGDLGVAGSTSDNAYNVARVVSNNSRLDGFTIRAAANDARQCEAPCAESYGGAIAIFASNFMLANCTVRDNSAGDDVPPDLSSGYGGGVYVGSGSASIISTTFFNNSARQGGGINVAPGAATTLVNTAFFGNRAAFAGGAFANAGTMTLVNTALSGNSSGAAPPGGGSAAWNTAQCTLINCSLSGNTGDAGAGVVVSAAGASTSLSNCILRTNPGAPAISGPAIATNSNVQGGAPGVGNFDADPLFVDADGPDNLVGTLDDNLQIRAGSSCIDRADPALLPVDTFDLDADGNSSEPVPLDLARQPRFVNDTGTPDAFPAAPDIGCFEFQGRSCRADANSSGAVDPSDIAVFVQGWILSLAAGSTDADFDRDGDVDPSDISTFIAAWLAALNTGC